MNNINYTKAIEKIQIFMSYPISSVGNYTSRYQLRYISIQNRNSSFGLPASIQSPASRLQLLILLVLLLTTGFGYSQNLQTYIEEAISNNPNIQAVEKQYAISTEKISEVNFLPDTEFSGGYAVGEEMPMMQQAEFSVMQMLPWFGTIAAREKYATAMANSDFVEIEIAKRKIALALSQSYYRLYELAKKQEVLNSNMELLRVYERMALTSVEVGQASAVSVLRLQMRQNELLERKLVLEQNYFSELTAFNKIMNREKVIEIAMVDSLALLEGDVEIDYSRLDFHPELAKFEELNEVVAQADALNKKESAPDFAIGVEYMLFHEAPNMLMPMATLSIPIFNKKYKSVARQNKLRIEELAIQRNASKNLIIAELQAAVRSRNSARIRLQTQDKNLKQAENANEILLKNYETGTIDFREVLDVQELQLQFQMNRVEAIAEFFKQDSIIDYYIEIK